MLKTIQKYANKIEGREYYDEAYIVPLNLPFSQYELVVDEAIEDIISNMEKYLNQEDDFKLNNYFTINIVVVDNLNSKNNFIAKGMGTYSLISYCKISGALKYLFVGEATDKFRSSVVNVNEYIPKYPLNVEITEEYPVNEFLEKFIYIEDKKYKIARYKIRYFLYHLFTSKESDE